MSDAEDDPFEDAPEAPDQQESTDPITTIMLSKEQQAIVKEETGRDMESMEIEDPEGFYFETMPNRDPDDILQAAILEAKRLNEEDAEMFAYLVALAKWQDEEEPELEEQLDDIEEELEEECKANEAAFLEEYGAEYQAIEEGKVVAVEAWDPKGKKREKLEKEGIDWETFDPRPE